MPRQCANIAARAKKKVCCTCTSVRITQQEKNSGAFTVMFKERTLFMRRKQICFYFTKAISVLFFYILTGTRCGRNTYLRFLYTRYSLDLSDWKKYLLLLTTSFCGTKMVSTSGGVQHLRRPPHALILYHHLN